MARKGDALQFDPVDYYELLSAGFFIALMKLECGADRVVRKAWQL